MSGIKRIEKNTGLKEKSLNTETFEKEIFDLSWFDDNLDRVLYTPFSNSDKKSRSLKNVFYASSLGNPCDRYLYLHYNDLLPQKEIGPQLQSIFDTGKIAQDKYMSYFQKMGVLLACEVKAKEEVIPISGRADFIIKLPNADRFIIELKTINNSGFAKLTKAKSEHAVQLLYYLHMLDVPFGAVLYENKDNQKRKRFIWN